MQKFLLRRLIIAIITIFVVSLIIFIMSRVSGDPRHIYLDDYSTQEDWDRMGALLGLDKPYYEQYGIFLKKAVRGDFGESIREGEPVMSVILDRLPNTLQLGVAAFAFSVLVGVPLGILSAVKRGSALDLTGKLVSLIGQSAPPFWLGIMLMFFFAVKLGWVPPYGRQEWSSILLPGITLGWFYVAANLRLIRSAMLDVLDSEYIKLARAKGVSPKMVIFKHALRNALIPPLTFAGVTLGALVTGSLVVETVFAWPGLGKLAIEALFGADYPLLQGVVIVFTLMYVTAALTVDVLYAYIDPRIRYG
ncbi:MAG: ABC transporter permease [Dehalococcoidia bacterium]|nr:ABC transporter permease [Dehalococcoidia bacterium]MDP7201424.1 ABC transporter permease [Dehalococcoidia bacterium]MDP7511902.1 ABC transporter permease [Dehalococcoidia bacterium]HJN87608.1 ABC transporter permease [Dehalococcoidia bacterium]